MAHRIVEYVLTFPITFVIACERGLLLKTFYALPFPNADVFANPFPVYIHTSQVKFLADRVIVHAA